MERLAGGWQLQQPWSVCRDASSATVLALQPAADALGSALGLPPDETVTFAEEASDLQKANMHLMLQPVAGCRHARRWSLKLMSMSTHANISGFV